ncbi:siderophore ABC transporter substrate-binding protein [Propionibacterium australiense]|nr:siderophore ABC transporter substrate-binding protein [Propionibacterium australiense]RLP12832.1 siderophore ABC transporter substrate-binding protein [Propionibacterium australiense]
MENTMAVSRRLLLAGAGAAAGAAALSACSSSDSSDTASSSAAGSAAGSYPVTVVHAQGELTLDAKPEKVVVFDLGVLDSMVALGIDGAVAGVPQNQNTYPDELSKFESDTYTNVGSLFEPDVEAIAELGPDLVIVANRSASSYEALAESFPTIDASAVTTESSGAPASGGPSASDQASAGQSASEERSSDQGQRRGGGGRGGGEGGGRNSSVEMTASLKNLATILGTAFGVQSEGQAKVDEFTSAAAEIKSLASGKGTGLALLTNGDAVSALGAGSRLDVIFNEFGVTPAVEDVEAQTHGEAISFEFIAEANPDMLFVLDRATTIGQEGQSAQELLDNDLVNGTNAGKNGKIFYLSGASWYIVGAGLNNSLSQAAEIKADLEK